MGPVASQSNDSMGEPHGIALASQQSETTTRQLDASPNLGTGGALFSLPEFMNFKLFGKTSLVVKIQLGLFLGHPATEALPGSGFSFLGVHTLFSFENGARLCFPRVSPAESSCWCYR